MAAHTNTRTPLGLCAMCFTRKPLSHRWAWLKLCADCAAKHGAAKPIGDDVVQAAGATVAPGVERTEDASRTGETGHGHTGHTPSTTRDS